MSPSRATESFNTGEYVALLDRRSPLNRMDLAMRARRFAQTRSVPAWRWLWSYNRYLARLQDRGMGAVWILAFAGVFHIDVGVVEAFSPEPSDPFVGSGTELTLHCPSGELIAAGVETLGNPMLRPLLRVAPGSYRVRLRSKIWDEPQGGRGSLDLVSVGGV